MRYTQSFARSCTLEEAQAVLLAVARTRLTPLPPSLPPATPTHTVPNLDANVSEVLQNSPTTSPHKPVETCPPPHLLIETCPSPPPPPATATAPPAAPPTAPPKYPLHVRGLPKAGSKTQQARYRTTL